MGGTTVSWSMNIGSATLRESSSPSNNYGEWTISAPTIGGYRLSAIEPGVRVFNSSGSLLLKTTNKVTTRYGNTTYNYGTPVRTIGVIDR